MRELQAWSAYFQTALRHADEAHQQWCDALLRPGADWRAAKARYFEIWDWALFAMAMCRLHAHGSAS